MTNDRTISCPLFTTTVVPYKAISHQFHIYSMSSSLAYLSSPQKISTWRIMENINFNGSKMPFLSGSSMSALSSSTQSLAYCCTACSTSPIWTASSNTTLPENKCWFVSTDSAALLQSCTIFIPSLSYRNNRGKKGCLPIA